MLLWFHTSTISAVSAALAVCPCWIVGPPLLVVVHLLIGDALVTTSFLLLLLRFPWAT